MKYQILTVGLKQDQLSHCRDHFAKAHTNMKNAISIPEAAHSLKEETNHLLVLDKEYIDYYNRWHIFCQRFFQFVYIIKKICKKICNGWTFACWSVILQINEVSRWKIE